MWLARLKSRIYVTHQYYNGKRFGTASAHRRLPAA